MELSSDHMRSIAKKKCKEVLLLKQLRVEVSQSVRALLCERRRVEHDMCVVCTGINAFGRGSRMWLNTKTRTFAFVTKPFRKASANFGLYQFFELILEIDTIFNQSEPLPDFQFFIRIFSRNFHTFEEEKVRFDA